MIKDWKQNSISDMVSLPVCEGASFIWMSNLFHLCKIFLKNMSKMVISLI